MYFYLLTSPRDGSHGRKKKNCDKMLRFKWIFNENLRSVFFLAAFWNCAICVLLIFSRFVWFDVLQQFRCACVCVCVCVALFLFSLAHLPHFWTISDRRFSLSKSNNEEDAEKIVFAQRIHNRKLRQWLTQANSSSPVVFQSTLFCAWAQVRKTHKCGRKFCSTNPNFKAETEELSS